LKNNENFIAQLKVKRYNGYVKMAYVLHDFLYDLLKREKGTYIKENK